MRHSNMGKANKGGEKPSKQRRYQRRNDAHTLTRGQSANAKGTVMTRPERHQPPTQRKPLEPRLNQTNSSSRRLELGSLVANLSCP